MEVSPDLPTLGYLGGAGGSNGWQPFSRRISLLVFLSAEPPRPPAPPAGGLLLFRPLANRAIQMRGPFPSSLSRKRQLPDRRQRLRVHELIWGSEERISNSSEKSRTDWRSVPQVNPRLT